METKENKNESANMKYPAGVTAELVESWKKENTCGVSIIQSGGYEAYIRRPTRNDMRELTGKNGTVDPVTYTEIVLDQLWLGGDEEIRTVDKVFYGAMAVVQEVLEVEAANIKKL